MTAFANAEGGVIIVGLSKGKVQGLRLHEPRSNDLRPPVERVPISSVRNSNLIKDKTSTTVMPATI